MAADSPEGPAPTMTTSRTDIRLMITKAGRQEGRRAEIQGRKAGRMERRGLEGGKAEGRRSKGKEAFRRSRLQPSPFLPSNLSAVHSCPPAFPAFLPCSTGSAAS